MTETIGKIAAALAKAQRAFKPVSKDRVAKAGSYSYRYANLADIMDAIREALGANELAIVQGVDGDRLVTRLIHSSGEFISNSVPLVTAQGQGPQAVGSSLTYSRRYGLCALLGIEADEDDDGALPSRASSPPRQTGRAPSAPPKTERPAQANTASGEHRMGGTTDDYKPAHPNWHNEPCTEAQRKKLWAMAKEAGYDEAHLKDAVMSTTGKESTKDLTKGEIQALFEEFEKMGAKK